MPVEESFGRHDEARRAVAALLGVVIDERERNRMRLGGRPDTFDGLNIFALRVDGEHSATIDDLLIHNDGAGAASAAIADALGAGHIEAIAESIAQCDSRLDGQALIFAVDL